MKNLFKTLSLIGLSLTLSVNAQTGSNKAKSPADLQSSSLNTAKSAYVSNQDYLSPSSLTGYKNYYGDSLKGFDQAKTKTNLLSKGLDGWEVKIHMEHLERQFIDQKYNLGTGLNYLPVSKPIKQTTPTTINGKPIGGNNSVNLLPCINEDFEQTAPGVYGTANAVNGWTISSRQSDGNCNPTNWTPGSSEFAIVSTPILNWGSVGGVMGAIPNSPLGGTVVAQLNDQVSDYNCTRITQQFPVTTANTLFQIAYAGYWQDGGAGSHACCPVSADQPGINVKMYDCLGAPLSCSSLSMSPGPGCQSQGVTFTVIPNVASWTQWQVKYIDLTPYIGSCVTIEISTSDCAFGGHWGSTLFDARCGGQLIGAGLGGAGGSIGGPVSFCAGSNQAQITAPVGYSTYQWFAPGGGSVAAPQGTMSTLVINNPVPGSIYTVQLTAPSGCIFTSTNAIVFSTVTIAGIGSSSTCPGGASGSATVAGNGSGTGYNYTWINSLTSATVGTTAIVNNLAPGTYSIILTGLGAAGCGSAVSTVTITTAPPGIVPLLKPFCNGEAYLGTAGGSNFRWYNGNTPIPPPLGTMPTYTVVSPINQSIYWLSYLSSQGCQDSVKFTLIASQPGLVAANPVSRICPGGNNGTAQINLSPAPGAPPGLNSYSVYATGTTAPYTASLFPTASNVYTVGGLSAGTYDVSVFDGSCKYAISFPVTPYTFTYNVTPTSVTLCPGNSIAAAVVFPNASQASQYTYSWSPTANLFGANAPNIIVTPAIAVGNPSVLVYNVVVTPTLINCPVTKSFTITAVNPAPPVINPVPNMCNTSNPVQITTNPPGGVFNSGITGTNNPISANGGVITPSLITSVINTFTYTITQYTCTAKSTGTFQVSKFWSSALSSTAPPLCVTSAPFNLMNIVQNTSNGGWIGATPGTVGGNFFNPANLNTGNYIATYKTVSTPNATVCPSSTNLTVTVTKTVTPVIQQVAEFCTNATQFTLSATPVGGGWSSASGAVNSNGVVSPTNVPTPSMVATYTVNDGPCLNTNTVTLRASKFYPAGFSGTITNLCFNSAPVNLMSIVQSTLNGSWTPTTGIQGNTFYPATLNTGIYTATYNTSSSPNPTLCTDTRTINISVLNPVMPNITPIGPICNSSGAIQLTVSPLTGHWTGSPYLSANGVFTPSLTSVGNNAIQYVVGTNTCNVQQTLYVSVEAFVPATIVSRLPDLCNTSPITDLGPFTLSNQGIWTGTGITGTNFNPASTGSGNFILKYSTSSSPSGLCPDQATVAVNVFSLAAPVVVPTGTICNSWKPFQLEVSPVGGLFGGPDGNIISLGGKFNPAAALIGDNVINYSITSGPCVAYAQTIINVEKFVSAELAKYVGPFCSTSEAVNLNSFAQNPNGTWTQANSETGLILNMFYPSQAMTGSMNHITYRTTSSTPNLCPDTRTFVIEVKSAREVDAIAVVQDACLPVEAVFNTRSVTAGDGTWTFGDGSEAVSGLSGVVHVFTTPGKYVAQFNYTDDIGCKSKPAVTQVINVYESPKADFSFPEEIYISEPSVQLTNLSTVLVNNVYSWKASGLLINGDINPTVTFPKIGKYAVTLTASSAHGCKNEITKTIEVKNIFNVFIPNTFSPNFDGLNDYFIPTFSKEGLDPKTFEMEIFDRWGHSLFHTKDATSKGWDGSVQNKGEALKEEVYVYRIKYKDMDGNAYNKMGHVSLIK